MGAALWMAGDMKEFAATQSDRGATGGRPLPRQIPSELPTSGAPTKSQSLVVIALVAIIYIYFLLFAQFGFLQGVRAGASNGRAMQAVLAAMAIAGVVASLAAPRAIAVLGCGGAMALGFLVSGGAAALAAIAFYPGLGFVGDLVVAAVGIGAGLGLATVGLAADLRRLTRARATGLHVGCGTGLAYLVCNIPSLYGSPPVAKAWVVAAIAVIGIMVVALSRGLTGARDGARTLLPAGWRSARGLVWGTAAFFALVWFDSAVFAALQFAPDVQERLWGNNATLWTNGAVHAVAACLSGILLDRGKMRLVLVASLALLVIGARGFTASSWPGVFAAPLYVSGVSLYSTALAAFAALAPGDAGQNAPAWRAAWVYAVAGWIGSAAGVGLAEQFHRVPIWAAPAALVDLTAACWAARGGKQSVEGSTYP
jgi:hypothetical protein